jgi:D-glycero-D-manno-heptose 1,7-bisphosphate phosphatase
VNKALFLDRDGVINVERGYVHRREDFQFLDGIFDLCRAAQRMGYLVVVATNQAGIARGYYTETEFLELTAWMAGRFAEHSIRIAGVYYCPYHPEHGIGPYRRDTEERKPRPGMILRAQADLELDLSASVLIGDKASDIAAAEAAGVGIKVLLLPGSAGIDDGDRGCYVAGSLEEVRQRFFPTA